MKAKEMRVRVYWNSIRREWAVVKVGNGNRKVTFYAEELTLTDASFHTGLKGKHAVCKSGHVNRHDYAEGKLASLSSFARRLNGPGKPLACHPVRKNRYNEFEATVGQEQRVAAGGRTIERVEFTSYGGRYAACSPVLCDMKRGVGAKMKAKMFHIIDGELHRTIELAGEGEYEVTIIYHPGRESLTLDVGRFSEYMCAWLREGGVLVAALVE